MKTNISKLKFTGDVARPYPRHSVVYQTNFKTVYEPPFDKKYQGLPLKIFKRRKRK